MATFIQEFPEDASQGWKISVIEKPGGPEQVITPALVRVVNPAFGELAIGKTPAGYHGWSFHENGGGGSVIVPFVRLWHPDLNRVELMVGVVRQSRPNQHATEHVENVPRGFLDPGESHFRAAMRESEEELGLSREALDLFEIDGIPGNPNSAFFETHQATDAREGVHFFGLKVAAYFLNPTAGEDGSRTFLSGVIQPRPSKEASDFASASEFKAWMAKRKLEELILGCRFIYADDALALGDLFTVSGTGRLQRHLRKFGPKAKSTL